MLNPDDKFGEPKKSSLMECPYITIRQKYLFTSTLNRLNLNESHENILLIYRSNLVLQSCKEVIKNETTKVQIIYSSLIRVRCYFCSLFHVMSVYFGMD